MGTPLPDLRVALLQGAQAHLDRRVVRTQFVDAILRQSNSPRYSAISRISSSVYAEAMRLMTV